MLLFATDTFTVYYPKFLTAFLKHRESSMGEGTDIPERKGGGGRENQISCDEANCSTLVIYPGDYSALSIIGTACQNIFFSNMLEVAKLISIENTWP